MQHCWLKKNSVTQETWQKLDDGIVVRSSHPLASLHQLGDMMIASTRSHLQGSQTGAALITSLCRWHLSRFFDVDALSSLLQMATLKRPTEGSVAGFASGHQLSANIRVPRFFDSTVHPGSLTDPPGIGGAFSQSSLCHAYSRGWMVSRLYRAYSQGWVVFPGHPSHSRDPLPPTARVTLQPLEAFGFPLPQRADQTLAQSVSQMEGNAYDV
ncbi:hypothetical protein GE09DRAFT_551851 [Coniochaeta sp. 2T2.1]|nr:hypothetical protein GE09DRAFT_551851 [Coniochaeta sp. 2T2.1]